MQGGILSAVSGGKKQNLVGDRTQNYVQDSGGNASVHRHTKLCAPLLVIWS